MSCNRSIMDLHWHASSHKAAAPTGRKRCALQKSRSCGWSALAVGNQITSDVGTARRRERTPCAQPSHRAFHRNHCVELQASAAGCCRLLPGEQQAPRSARQRRWRQSGRPAAAPCPSSRCPTCYSMPTSRLSSNNAMFIRMQEVVAAGSCGSSGCMPHRKLHMSAMHEATQSDYEVH